MFAREKVLAVGFDAVTVLGKAHSEPVGISCPLCDAQE